MTISTAVFIVYPSCQNLRPEQLPRDNLLTGIVQMLYTIDTNTNVFPSEHAIGALVVLLSSLQKILIQQITKQLQQKIQKCKMKYHKLMIYLNNL